MPPKAPPKAPAKGKKAPPTGLAALKAQMARVKDEEERRRREEEAEERRIKEEEERQKAEEAAKAAEKERRATDGKMDGSKKKLLEQQKRVEELRKAGMIVPDVVMDAPEAKGKVNRNMYAKKKVTKPKVEHVDPTDASVAPVRKEKVEEPAGDDASEGKLPSGKPTPEVKPTVAHELEEEDELVDDWMQLDEEAPARNFAAEFRSLVAKEEQIRNQQTTSEENDRKTIFTQELKRRKAAKAEEERAKEEKKDKELRSPICCVLGHVDAGKTSLLDKLRRTNVQGGEAGGITQQIGATFFPLKNIIDQTKELAAQHNLTVRIPGLLIIDTPGHESFTNLRSRGSSLCDVAVVVVDFMKGIEPQTRESLNLLRQRKCNFVVVMNKVDRLYGWKPQPNKPIQAALKAQERFIEQEYDNRVHNIKSQLMAEGFNSELYYKSKDFRKTVSLVPVSARSGEGIPDLLALLVQIIQKFMEQKVVASSQLECTVLEVKKTEGQGTTLDVILVNGQLNLGDRIVCCGFNGPIVTTVRALMTPQPCKELRVRGEYMYHKEVKAAMGCKIAAHDLDEAVAGTPLYVVDDDANLEKYKADVMKDLGALMKNLDHSGRGICVQASTLGSLEALLRFLHENGVSVAHIALGPIHKRHMLSVVVAAERDPVNAVMLAFDVQITREAQEIADQNNIKIFHADVIYKLFDMFVEHTNALKAKTLESNTSLAVFPASFQIIPGSVFRAADPIILGVEVLQGQLRPNTPVFCKKPDGGILKVGTVVSVESERTAVPVSRAGANVSVKIQPREALTVGRHIPETAVFYSDMNRAAIDALKESFRSEMEAADWHLVVAIKKMLEIM